MTGTNTDSVIARSISLSRSRLATWLALAAVLLVALNLRAPIAAVAPVLVELRADLGLSRGAAGLLTTLPVLCFGLLSPLATLLGRRVGSEVALLGAMVLLVTGMAVRSAAGFALVLVGTVVIGAAITIGNVLVPGLIKQDFPHLTGLATGLYTTALTGGAALAAGLTAPVERAAGFGWRGALFIWVVPAALAALVWLPQLRQRHRPPSPVGAGTRGDSVWRAPLAWQLAAFMGSQSLLFYSVLAWLPALLQERGVSATQAGLMLSVFNLLGIVGSLSLPSLAVRRPDQRWLAALTALGWFVGLAGLLTAPSLYVVWTVLLGLTQGAGIAMALTLVVLRAAGTGAARELSGMVQTVGYPLSAFGPFAVGALRDVTGSWSTSLVVLTGLAALMTAAAVGAGRDRHIG